MKKTIAVVATAVMAFWIPSAARAEFLESLESEVYEMQAEDEADIGDVLVAQNAKRRTTAKKRTTRPSTRTQARPTAERPSSSAGTGKKDPYMARVRSLAAAGNYQDASKLLFQMSRSSQYAKDTVQIRYLLGLMFFEMKLNQSAAFVFYDVVRQEGAKDRKSRFLRQGLEKLALSADMLDSDVLLRYAIKQVDEEEFPAANRDMLYFRTGELKMQERQYMEAARQFQRVRTNSLFFNRARYNLALALAEAGEGDKGQLEKAQAAFEDLIGRLQGAGPTHHIRVSALLGRARVLYQRQQFASAIEAYREVPRDTEQWHEGLFESTWAMLRDGRFRSMLSNFHSLHSPFYEDFYQPESLLLRAIVYLYICRYDEMEKVLELFERVYKPVANDVKNVIASTDDPLTYYKELAKIRDNFDAIRANRVGRRGFVLPFQVAREVLKEGDVRRTFNYIDQLENEKKRIDGMPTAWKSASVGLYARKIVEKRIEATRVLAGKQIRRHLILIQNELRDLLEQDGFLRFEMINGKREALKKEIQGKGLERTQVDEDTNRNYYIQNGYEYWPFKGEYWLDEIGNYHYVGVKACE
ncbi:MAG: tetratricopeptide repeat protein [Bdellovibrionota bacterium]